MVLQQGNSVDEKKAEANALYAMVVFGVGDVLGGVLFGWVIDKIGSK
jgi:F0F1-type ATP synthase assembly protein I